LLAALARSGSVGARIEAVSADSMQVYRGMDLGTAKPDAALRSLLPHHLIDLRDPREPFTSGDFVRLAKEAIADCLDRGVLPVVCGGTAFYLSNLVFGMSEAPPSDPALREELRLDLARLGPEALLEELRALDPESAARIHPNDSYRLTRALEVTRGTGLPLSSFKMRGTGDEDYDFRVLAVTRPREELYKRIEARVDDMMASGLRAELEALVASGHCPDEPGLRAIGYAEFFVPEGEGGWALSPDAAAVAEAIKLHTRRYAKRQLTFFKSIPGIGWIGPEDEASLAAALRTCIPA
jgi:tRNA dimethylallyltransferase